MLIKDIEFLEALIDSNSVLQDTNSTLNPLEVGESDGFQDWRDGKMERLVLANNNLTKIPESICNIYNDISLFDISNNDTSLKNSFGFIFISEKFISTGR